MKLLLLVGILLYIVAIYFSQKKYEAIRNEIPKLLYTTRWIRGSAFIRQLRDKGIRVSGPTFYTHMGDLTRKGIVEFQDVEETIDFDDFAEAGPVSRRNMKPVEDRMVQLKVRWFRLPSSQ